MPARFPQSKILGFSYIPEIIRMAMGLIQITKNLVSNMLIRVQFPSYHSEGLTLETSPSDVILFIFFCGENLTLFSLFIYLFIYYLLENSTDYSKVTKKKKQETMRR